MYCVTARLRAGVDGSGRHGPVPGFHAGGSGPAAAKAAGEEGGEARVEHAAVLGAHDAVALVGEDQ